MENEKLIIAVQSRPFIYNKADRNHRKRDVVLAAWENIGKEIGADATACKSRWISIRDYFLKEYRKSKTTKSGQAANKKRKWHLYDSLSFLIPTYSSHETSGNLQDYDEDNPNTELETDDEDTQHQDSSLSLNSQENSSSKPFKKLRQKRKKCCGGMSELDREVLKALREPEPQPEVDENELFFRSLLPSMKRLDEIQTLEFRLEVQSLLLKHLKSSRSTTMAVGASTSGFMAPTCKWTQGSHSQGNYPHYLEEYFSQNAYS